MESGKCRLCFFVRWRYDCRNCRWNKIFINPHFWYLFISEYTIKNNKYDFTDIYVATLYEGIGETKGSSAFYVDKKLAVKYVNGEKLKLILTKLLIIL